jgi:hypothetical protein
VVNSLFGKFLHTIHKQKPLEYIQHQFKLQANGKSEEGLYTEAEVDVLLFRVQRLRLEIGNNIELEKVARDTKVQTPFLPMLPLNG